MDDTSEFLVHIFVVQKPVSSRKLTIVTSPSDLPEDWDSEIHICLECDGIFYFVDKTLMDFCLSQVFYVCRSSYLKFKIGYRRSVYLHRWIAKTPSGLFCDHINGNKRDNRSLNLRNVHPSLNNHNKKINGNSRGIIFKKNKWQASISVQRKSIYLGRFDTKEEAQVAYDLAAVKIYGAAARPLYPISNYKLPDKPLIESYKVTEKFNQKGHTECTWPTCSDWSLSASIFCYRHSIIAERRKDKNILGQYVRAITYEVSDRCVDPSHGTDKVKVFSRNLCAFHYRKIREKEGYKKKKKKYQCEFILPDGNRCIGVAIKIKDRLCSTHFKEKNNLFKMRGRPAARKIPCSVCGNPASHITGFCKTHYFEDYRKKRGSR